MTMQDTPNKSVRRRLLVALRMVVSAALIVLLLSRVDMRRLIETWRALSPAFLLLALGLQLGGVLISSAKWWLLLRAQRRPVPYGWTVRTYLIGQFFSNFLPTMIGGDAVRVMLLRERIGSGALALASVFLERLTGFLALLAIAWVALGLSHGRLAAATSLMSGVLWCLLLGSAAVAAATSAPLLARGIARLRLPNVLDWQGRLRMIAAQITSYSGYPVALMLVVVLAVGYQISWVAVNGVAARALHLTIPWRYVALMVPISDIVALVPVFLNGLGAREATYALLLAELNGTPTADAIALSFLIFVIRLAVSALGGLLYLLGGSRVTHATQGEHSSNVQKS